MPPLIGNGPGMGHRSKPPDTEGPTRAWPGQQFHGQNCNLVPARSLECGGQLPRQPDNHLPGRPDSRKTLANLANSDP